ncbi:MAG: hypothetical protein KGD68_10055 [Candidatus Lokiarchaeota archaeon]|nr:hypothetical protein [Candidatus Lokiarchaeota archaeon]
MNFQGFLVLNSSQYKDLKPNHSISSYPGDNSSWDCTWGLGSSYDWEKIITDSANCVYVSGRIVVNRWNDTCKMFIVKLNESGDEQWNFTTRINGDYYCKGISIDSEFNIYNLGLMWKLSDTEWSLLKFNSSGDLLWNRTFIGNANCMYVDSFNKIYVSGFTFDWETDDSSLFLIKFNEMGSIQWNNTLITGYIRRPYALLVDEFNNTYSAGIYSDGTADLNWHVGHFCYAADIFFWRYDFSGDLISNEILDMGLYHISSQMFFDNFTHLYLIGTDDSFAKSILFKYNYSGELQLRIDWQKDSLEDHSELWRNIAFDSSENIYCTGENYFWTGKPFYEIYLVKFNKTGKMELEGAWKKYNQPYLEDTFVDSSNNIFITGSCEYGVFIVKNPIWGPFSNPIFYLDEETIFLIIVFSVIFGVWILLGTLYYIYSLNKVPSQRK